ncbi:MAG: hypothetical protein JSU66_11090 [Deltaproteobacteria bacterium]|nr:MAG: hypothetical protein JSU66_11090 [Deltaproteobacteria bacterium]
MKRNGILSPRRLWCAAAFCAFALAIAWTHGAAWRAGAREAVPRSRAADAAAAASKAWENTGLADATFATWLVGRNAHTLLRRPWNLFDTEHCAPGEKTMTRGEPMISLGLLGAPAALWTDDPILIYNWALVALALVSAFAMYLLVSAWTGAPAAGIAAGLFYAFHPIKLHSMAHAFIQDTGWTVLALFFAHRLFARGRWWDALGLGASTALQMGASFYPFLAAVFLAPPFALWLLFHYRLRNVKLAQLLFVGAVAALAAWIVFGPYLEARSGGELLRRANQIYAPWSSYLPGHAAFPGWVAIPFIAAALFAHRARALRGLDGDPRWAIVVGALLVALAAAGGNMYARMMAIAGQAPPPLPIPNLYALVGSVLPGLDSVRAVDKLKGGVHVAASILLGLGIAAAIRRAPVRWGGAVAAAAVLAVALDVLRPAALGLPPRIAYVSERIRPDPSALAFFEELAAGANDGPILELPFERTTIHAIAHAPGRILLSGYHHRRTSACFASYMGDRGEIAEIVERLPARAALFDLQRLGFTTLLVHAGTPKAASLRAAFDAEAASPAGALARIQASPALSAYAIGR